VAAFDEANTDRSLQPKKAGTIEKTFQPWKTMDRLQSMDIFRWVVDLGSFSRAADRLDLSKATVTAHVASLENRLGIKLLNRTTRRLALTDDGAAYLDHVRRVLADVEETETLLTAGRTTPRGVLHVNLLPALGRQFVIPALPRFAAQYPDLRVVATLDDRRVDLVAEGVDVALRVGGLEDSSLVARRVYEDRFVAVASPDYLALHGMPQSPADLADHQCLGLWSAPRAGVLEWTFEKDGQRTNLVPGGRFSVNDAEALIDAAVAGAGIVMMIDLLTRRWIASGALQAVLAEWRPRDAIPISLVYPQNRHLSAKVRVFCDFVAGLFPRRRE
jgi:LysR family transcriptional regulator, regulator for bpeEF and oprC